MTAPPAPAAEGTGARLAQQLHAAAAHHHWEVYVGLLALQRELGRDHPQWSNLLAAASHQYTEAFRRMQQAPDDLMRGMPAELLALRREVAERAAGAPLG